jgi:hypothetical protein
VFVFSVDAHIAFLSYGALYKKQKYALSFFPANGHF